MVCECCSIKSKTDKIRSLRATLYFTICCAWVLLHFSEPTVCNLSPWGTKMLFITSLTSIPTVVIYLITTLLRLLNTSSHCTKTTRSSYLFKSGETWTFDKSVHVMVCSMCRHIFIIYSVLRLQICYNVQIWINHIYMGGGGRLV